MWFRMVVNGVFVRQVPPKYPEPIKLKVKLLQLPKNEPRTKKLSCIFMAEMDVFVNAILMEMTHTHRRAKFARI